MAITHFEIKGENLEALMRFYSEVFGWRFERAPGPDEYWMIQTMPVEELEAYRTPISGGLTGAESESGIINFVSVESVDECCIKIEELGGRILEPKREVFDMGWSALAEDPEGNRFAVWQDMT